MQMCLIKAKVHLFSTLNCSPLFRMKNRLMQNSISRVAFVRIVHNSV